MLAAPCRWCGLFGSSWTEAEELLNGHHRLTECKCLNFGVSLGHAHRVTFLSQEGYGRVRSDLDVAVARQGM